MSCTYDDISICVPTFHDNVKFESASKTGVTGKPCATWFSPRGRSWMIAVSSLVRTCTARMTSRCFPRDGALTWDDTRYVMYGGA